MKPSIERLLEKLRNQYRGTKTAKGKKKKGGVRTGRLLKQQPRPILVLRGTL